MGKRKIINEETVDHVAHLARLELTLEERSPMADQLEEILSYVNMLNSLDTTSIEATFQVLPCVNVMREDLVEPSLGSQAALANAPMSESVPGGRYFRMPRIMDMQD